MIAYDYHIILVVPLPYIDQSVANGFVLFLPYKFREDLPRGHWQYRIYDVTHLGQDCDYLRFPMS